MSKLKVVLLIILAAVLVDFAVENAQPARRSSSSNFSWANCPSFC